MIYFTNKFINKNKQPHRMQHQTKRQPQIQSIKIPQSTKIIINQNDPTFRNSNKDNQSIQQQAQSNKNHNLSNSFPLMSFLGMKKQKSVQKQQNYHQKVPQKLQSFNSKATQQEQQQFENQALGKANNIISQILDQSINLQTNDPQLTKIKNSILLILLLFSSYGVYYVAGQFLDVILLAIIAGISYQQARNNFVTLYLNDQTYVPQYTITTFKKRFMYGLIATISILALPFIRKILSNPDQITKVNSIAQIFMFGFQKKQSRTIYHLQLLGGAFVLSIIAGAHNTVKFLRIIKIRGKYAKKIVQIIFAIGVIIIILTFLIITPLVFYRQLIVTGSQIQTRIQTHFNCSLMDVGTSNENSLPHCHEIITGSQFLKQTLTEFKYQNQTINQCVSIISTFQEQYLNRNTSLTLYAQEICTWIRLGQKANQYFNENTKNMVLSTSTSVLKTIFGNLTSLIQLFSMFLFNLTTFITVFYLTVSNFNPSKNIFSQIFTGQRRKLISQITTLIQGTFFIVIQHFIISFILLQIFSFSSINLILSLILSLMAFIPLFRPWFGILILASISVLVNNLQMLLSIEQFVTTLDLYSALLLVIVYYYISQTIYSINLVKMQIHQIITNMTVLFGIYKFGVVGIFYGPLILILFRCVHRQLLRSNYSRISLMMKKKN